MKVFDKRQIMAALDVEDALARIEHGFIAYSSGAVQVPPVQAFAFAQDNGDCCIKSAYVDGEETFTVKVSTGFYHNPGKGLDSNDGLMLVLCARTGRPLALLQDEGWLTGMRTALAGRIVARLLAPREVTAIGVLGTGVQARLQLEQLLAATTCRKVVAWGRSEGNVRGYAEFARRLGCSVQIALDPEQVARAANLIVCATPARRPLLDSTWIRPGTHITALGADALGKRELDVALVRRADRLVVDSIKQCSRYGEVSGAVNEEPAQHERLLELGTLLAGGGQGRASEQEITLADLTGVAVQDAQIASSVFASLQR
ncbi:ornithine cyclodeaminase family protein [Pseudomonas sp.]|uniref:ornithine cyclodeaminase family protein n=1 Tax=Pseudomonas sp. TaxID=306 RepID=UPI0028B1AD3F|nr:ornithine cyclodeaminase family protein [Pseudomonas sp.]